MPRSIRDERSLRAGAFSPGGLLAIAVTALMACALGAGPAHASAGSAVRPDVVGVFGDSGAARMVAAVVAVACDWLGIGEHRAGIQANSTFWSGCESLATGCTWSCITVALGRFGPLVHQIDLPPPSGVC